MREYNTVGSFRLTQPIMRVSDPSYSKDVWRATTVSNCKLGQWDAAIVDSSDTSWDRRVGMLIVKHSSLKSFTTLGRLLTVKEAEIVYGGTWKVECKNIGVDSAAACFFDEAFYGKPINGEDFHDAMGDLAYGTYAVDILEHGVVSSSGIGDGCYLLMTHTNLKKEIDAMALIFDVIA